MRISSPLLLVLAATAALAGCGGSSSSSGNGQLTKAQAQSLAQQINLRAGDLAGSTSTPAQTQTMSNDSALSTCAGTSPPSAALAHASSPNLTVGAGLQQQQVSSSTSVMPSADVVKSDLAAMQLPKAHQCIEQLLPKLMASAAAGQATFGKVTVEPLFMPVPNTDGTWGYSVKVSAQAGGQSIPLTINEIGVAKGRYEMTLNSFWIGPPLSKDAQTRLLELLAGRAAQAKASS